LVARSWSPSGYCSPTRPLASTASVSTPTAASAGTSATRTPGFNVALRPAV